LVLESESTCGEASLQTIVEVVDVDSKTNNTYGQSHKHLAPTEL